MRGNGEKLKDRMELIDAFSKESLPDSDLTMESGTAI